MFQVKRRAAFFVSYAFMQTGAIGPDLTFSCRRKRTFLRKKSQNLMKLNSKYIFVSWQMEINRAPTTICQRARHRAPARERAMAMANRRSLSKSRYSYFQNFLKLSTKFEFQKTHESTSDTAEVTVEEVTTDTTVDDGEGDEDDDDDDDEETTSDESIDTNNYRHQGSGYIGSAVADSENGYKR